MLTPSNSHLWTACSLAGRLNAGGAGGAPRDHTQDSEARREGKAAHWVAELVLRGDADSCAECLGEMAPNGWMVSAEMVRNVQAYVDLVRAVGPHVEAERIITLAGVIRGRLDAHPLTVDGVLNIFDLKYGWRLVEAERNTALLCYAGALFDPKRHSGVALHIFQPRPYHPDGKLRTWRLTAAEFPAWLDWLIGRADAAHGADPVATPGPQCGDCAGAGSCQALAASIYRLHDVVEDRRIGHMTAAELAAEVDFIRRAAGLVKARQAAIEAEAAGRIRRGEYVPGWTMEKSLGNRKFTASPAAIQLMTGLNPYKQVLMTPAEMEDEGALEVVLDRLTDRENKGSRLVPLTSKMFTRMFAKNEQR